MVTEDIKDKIDRELYEIETQIKVDKKGKVRYNDLFRLITDARIKVNKILSKA